MSAVIKHRQTLSVCRQPARRRRTTGVVSPAVLSPCRGGACVRGPGDSRVFVLPPFHTTYQLRGSLLFPARELGAFQNTLLCVVSSTVPFQGSKDFFRDQSGYQLQPLKGSDPSSA